MRNIAIVGASLAGLSTARALRNQGFDGRVSIIGAEPHRPYDRPPLSKAFLAGAVTEDDLTLESPDEDLGLDWQLGRRAVALRPGEQTVELEDGSRFVADAVVLATGARPRTLPDAGAVAGLHTLRTLDDARALRADLRAGSRLAVVGAGFIGSEVAATASGLGVEVTVVEVAPTPLAGPLGVQLGAVVAGLHAAHGVRLRTGVAVVGIASAGRVTGLALADGTTVPADTVLVGVGVTPNVEWLAGSGLDLAGGVVCDGYGATGVPNVVAVGDCAAWYDDTRGAPHRLEHWTAARERGPIAAATLLSGGTDQRRGRAPYVWSDQYGITIQLAGHTHGADEVTVEEGSTDAHDFLAVYRRAGTPIGVLALGHGKSFMRWRRQLGSGSTPAASLATGE